MCGICGIHFTDKERVVSPDTLNGMCDVITHRGPDDSGIHIDGATGIGMRRLSIIDLVTGHQPMCNEDESVWLVFNGEIYNHQELRKELQAKGHIFKTKSDSEAIIHAYEEYGGRCVHKLNGMFAFAIWDRKKRQVLLARDRLGIKPLYYSFDGKTLVFGSELKSLLRSNEVSRDLDLAGLDNFLTFEYIPSPLTLFTSIKKLPPGHILLMRDGQIKTYHYWDLKFYPTEEKDEIVCEKFREIFQDAVKIRLMSDVPLGAFLSGGIDSSSLVAMMSQVATGPVKTFSIGFENQSYNELEYARLIAEHFETEHHEFIIEPRAVDLISRLINSLDEPIADFSIFPTFLVSEMARQHVTVALSGDGGDELFAGYDTYIADRICRQYQHLPLALRNGLILKALRMIPPTSKKKGLINSAKRFAEGAALPEDLHHVRWMTFLSNEEKNLLFDDHVKFHLNGRDPFTTVRSLFDRSGTDDLLHQQLYVDINFYLPEDILVKVDRMSMATSLEARVPFLDHRIVEFSATIPSRKKLKGFNTKYILKKAMADILPKKILHRGKEGFSIPIKEWLKEELKPMMLDLLSEERIKREGYFNWPYIDLLVKEHLSNKDNHSHRLWALMLFEMWQDKFLK